MIEVEGLGRGRAVLFFVLTALLALAAKHAGAQAYELPFHADDLDEGNLKVFWGRAIHSDSGVQKYGYDLGVQRYDGETKAWTEYKKGGEDRTKNSDSLVYGKNIYAMRAGKIIACWRNAPENKPKNVYHPKVDEGYVYGGGNGYWIEHADGTRVEYAHMIPGSVPSELCPHDAEFLPTKIANPSVELAWPQIRVTNGKQVAAGQLLGRAGNVGTASDPHLHVHVEKGGRADTVKSGGEPVKIEFKHGLVAPESSEAHPDWKSFAGKSIPPGPVIIWPQQTLVGEYARHGYPATQFQELFDHLTDSGFWPVWLDTYSVGDRSYVNEIWRPAQKEWRAHCLRDGATHQKLTDDADRDGFAAVYVDSSVSGGQVLYTAIFVKGKPADIIMRHGLTTAQHDAERDNAKQRHLRPVNISVASVDGQRSYTVLYRPETIGAWAIQSQIPESGYQHEYDEQKAAGRRPIALDAYMHDGQPFLSAVFGAARPAGKDRHMMSADDYQTEFDSALNAGLLTHAVTSFDGAQSQHRFAAAWWK
jgi:Bacterial tandem repeat domain 1